MRKDRQLIVDYLAAGDWPSVVLNRPGRKGNTHRPGHHRARVGAFRRAHVGDDEWLWCKRARTTRHVGAAERSQRGAASTRAGSWCLARGDHGVGCEEEDLRVCSCSAAALVTHAGSAPTIWRRASRRSAARAVALLQGSAATSGAATQVGHNRTSVSTLRLSRLRSVDCQSAAKSPPQLFSWEFAEDRGKNRGKNALNFLPGVTIRQNTGSEIDFKMSRSGERGSNPRPQLWELSDSSLQRCEVIHRSSHFKLKRPAPSTLVNVDPWENRGNVGNG